MSNAPTDLPYGGPEPDPTDAVLPPVRTRRPDYDNTPTERPMDLLTTGPQPGEKQRFPYFDNKGSHEHRKRPWAGGYLGRSI